MGATEQLFGLLRGEFEQMPEGLKLRFDWYISGFKKEGKKENILKDREVEREKERKKKKERKRNKYKDIIDHRSYTHSCEIKA